MRVKFTDNGNMESWSGSPILLDSRFRQDPEVLEEIKPWRQKLDKLTKQIIGSVAQVMTLARSRECTMGNFVADAMVQSWQGKRMPDGSQIRQVIMLMFM